MLEVVALDERLMRSPRLARAARGALDLGRCEILTRRQRLYRACVWWMLGVVAALTAIEIDERHFVNVMLLPPVVESSDEGLSVYRLRLEWHGIEKVCRLTVHHRDSLNWSITC
jgi:hypothetical protein